MSFFEITRQLTLLNRSKNYNTVRWFIFICSTVAITTFYMKMIYDRAYLEMVLTTNVKSGNFQLYWADAKQPFSEAQSLKFRVIGGKERLYSFYFTDLTKVRRIRIDPLETPGKVKIHYISLTQEEISPITLIRGKLRELVPIRDVKKVSHGADGISIESSGGDPGLLWELNPEILSTGRLTELLRFLAAIAASWLMAYCLTSSGNLLRKIHDVAWWVVLTLVVIMATTSEFNKHPDEHVHANAGLYYHDHWLPPKVCQPGTENTYSAYGLSRLHSKEMAYLLIGKVTSMLSFLPMYDYLRLRFFNVLLLILIILMWYKYKNGSMLFIPLLITPQAWYIFSYSNSDAFACFVAFFVAHQLAFPNTFLKRCWYSDKNEPWLFGRTIICGMLLSLIYFTKPNYYIIYVFFTGYFLIEFLFDRGSFKIPWQRVLGFLVGSVIFVFFLYSQHILINGMDRKQKIEECREKLARPRYKPSTPLDKTSTGLYLKRKGIPLSYLLEDKQWGERMFRSSVGVYGYTRYSGPEKYYLFMKTLMIILGITIGMLTFYGASNKERLLFIWTTGCILLLIGLVLWRCWVSDFQAQGRYLLPILPMVGVMMYKARSAVDKPIVNLLALILLITGCYSFIFIGLVQIPKI